MIPGPGIIPADGWWFIARSADGGHLMLICTYQIDQTITSNHMQYNAWGVRDIDGYGCIVFEKDPSSIGPGVLTGGRFTALATTPCSSGSIIRSSNQSSIISPAMITVLCNFHSPGGTMFTHHTMGFMNHHIQRFVDTACCQVISSV